MKAYRLVVILFEVYTRHNDPNQLPYCNGDRDYFRNIAGFIKSLRVKAYYQISGERRTTMVILGFILPKDFFLITIVVN